METIILTVVITVAVCVFVAGLVWPQPKEIKSQGDLIGLARSITIIEGLTGKEVTSIRYAPNRTGVFYQVNNEDEQYLLL